jgi:uncharacterized membrane protein
MTKIAIALVIAGALSASLHILSGYSYWFDELFSVQLSAYPLETLYRQALLDVHPPLYALILKAWMSIFGASEPITRGLSWLFSVSALIIIWRFSKNKGNVFCLWVIVIFSTNTLFIYYANETRSYALTLLLSTALIARYPFERYDKVSLDFLVLAILLSLTHYFGLVLAGVTLGLCLFHNRRRFVPAVKLVITGAICLAWTALHASVGTLIHRGGDGAWIKPHTATEALDLAAYGLLPGAMRWGAGWVGIVMFLLFAVLLLLALSRYSKELMFQCKLRETYIITITAVSLILLVISTAVVIDHFVPVATVRNFIVLLPLFAVAVAGSAQILAARLRKGKSILSGALCLFAVVALIVSNRALNIKISPPQDWKLATLTALANVSSAEKIYVTHSAISHYVESLRVKGDIESRVENYTAGLTDVSAPAVLIFGQLSSSERDKLLQHMKSLSAMQIYFDHRSPSDVGVFLIR